MSEVPLLVSRRSQEDKTVNLQYLPRASIRTAGMLMVLFSTCLPLDLYATPAVPGSGAQVAGPVGRPVSTSGAGKPNVDIADAHADSNGASSASSALDGIVYTRVRRTLGPVSVRNEKTGSTYILKHPDVWDVLTDVVKNMYDFNAPGQLIILRPDGTETIIYDCFTTDKPCVPMDPSVSLDGKKIAFTVFRSDNLYQSKVNDYVVPNSRLGRTNGESQIFVYDIASGQLTPWPHETGVYDGGATWLPDGRMMFTSSRLGQYLPYLRKVGSGSTREFTLFIADADGGNPVSISPHESSVLHPYLLDNGRVIYGSFWAGSGLPYISNNGSINWTTTMGNMWMLGDIDYRGGDATSLFGSHRSRFVESPGSRAVTLKAIHFAGQRNNQDVCAGNYYRGNNLALGDVFCWPLMPKGLEGPVPTYLPTGLYRAFRWSKSEDNPNKNPRAGKVGWPEGAADNGLIVTLGRGFCSTVASGIPVSDKMIEAAGQIGCDVGIYRTTVIPSKSLSDLEVVVDRPEWHEFGARRIKTRNIAVPKLPMADSCIITSSDAGTTDVKDYRKKGYSFNHNYYPMANNGTVIDGIDHGELAAIRFYSFEPNLTNRKHARNTIGNVVGLLGDAPLLPDKSFKAELPCDQPYLMVGIDRDGRVIMRDQIPQSLRPREIRVCSGCHLHSRQGRPYEASLAYKAEPTKLLKITPVPTYTQDIRPIFAQKCMSCHESDVPLLDYNALVWDFQQRSVPKEMKIRVGKGEGKRAYGLQRPYTSKYINSQFARESLLYWKAANERTDGRTDTTYANDIDFGSDHPTGLSRHEIELVGDWIDSGAARGPE